MCSQKTVSEQCVSLSFSALWENRLSSPQFSADFLVDTEELEEKDMQSTECDKWLEKFQCGFSLVHI